ECNSDQLARADARIVEIAIGEGSLSARLFDGQQSVTAVDLNPYSLVVAAQLPHVGRAIVADALHPPLGDGSFDVLVGMNFLHHVTEKRAVIGRWARVAPLLLFNEGTPYWATGWGLAYLARQLGLRRLAGRLQHQLTQNYLQHLEPSEALDEHVQAHSEI